MLINLLGLKGLKIVREFADTISRLREFNSLFLKKTRKYSVLEIS